MSTCKDCLHIDVCKDYASYDKDSIISCDNFKPKSDYAPVVRCKDCTEWDEKEMECSLWYGFRENDFCSYGERKESEVQGE